MTHSDETSTLQRMERSPSEDRPQHFRSGDASPLFVTQRGPSFSQLNDLNSTDIIETPAGIIVVL